MLDMILDLLWAQLGDAYTLLMGIFEGTLLVLGNAYAPTALISKVGLPEIVPQFIGSWTDVGC